MSYNSNSGKPFEYASKIAHSHIINDEQVQEYLNNCEIPIEAKDVDLDQSNVYEINYPSENSIENIIAVDGGYTTIPVKKSFPSSLITFFQFGALLIKREHLDEIDSKPFISPSDMKTLKNIERSKLVIPTKNVSLQKGVDLKFSVRKTIYKFFERKDIDNKSMLETLYWFLFQLYDGRSNIDIYKLSHCPHCGERNIELAKDKIDTKTYMWNCPKSKCQKEIFITDVFRLFEDVDNETGAGGILGYVANLVESFIIIHIIKTLLEIEENLISKFLLVKDGPLSFIGQTANMHKPMRALLNFILKTRKVNLVGVEKSGAFVDHAKEIKDKLSNGQILLLSNKHIYNYILQGNPESDEYAKTSYYSGKVIYKTHEGNVYVLTIPVESSEYYNRPELTDLKNIEEILMNIDMLKCDIYEDALIPVALANKLISLSNRPSSNILEKFAHKSIKA